MDTPTRLHNVPLFAALAPDQLAQVAEIATRRQYPRGSYLCREDTSQPTLYIIDSGEAILRKANGRGSERPSAYLRAGEMAGDDALILGEPYGYSLQATTDVEALCIRKEDLDQLVLTHPPIRERLSLRPLIRERLQVRALPGQDENEPWLLRRHKHWFVLARSLLVPIGLFAALVGVAAALELCGVPIDWPVAILLAGAIPAMLLAWHYVDWRNDYYLLTARRLLHHEQVLLRSESRHETLLTRIQNITIKSDARGKLLGYATLFVETASARGMMTLDYLRDAEGMQEVIFTQIRRLTSISQQQAREEIRQNLDRRLNGEQETLDTPTSPVPSEPEPRPGSILDRFRLTRPLWSARYTQQDRVTWRKHHIFLIQRIWLLLPLFLLVSAAIPAILISSSLHPYRLSMLLACLVLWIVLFFWLWWEFTDWRNDEYIVTDRSIIDIAKKPLFFAEERKEARLDVIQNVSYTQKGIWPTLLNYGDVLIQTAGPGVVFTFDGVANPLQVQREIFRRIEEYSEARKRREGNHRTEELLTWFDVYHNRGQSTEPPAAV